MGCALRQESAATLIIQALRKLLNSATGHHPDPKREAKSLSWNFSCLLNRSRVLAMQAQAFNKDLGPLNTRRDRSLTLDQ